MCHVSFLVWRKRIPGAEGKQREDALGRAHVHVCVCVCVCMHMVSVCIVCTYTYTCACMYVCAPGLCIHTCVHMCVHMYLCACEQAMVCSLQDQELQGVALPRRQAEVQGHPSTGTPMPAASFPACVPRAQLCGASCRSMGCNDCFGRKLQPTQKHPEATGLRNE